MIWLYIKISIIILGMSLTIFTRAVNQYATPPMTIEHLSIAIVFGVFSVQFMLVIELFKTNKQSWEKPIWKQNPFNLKQPLHFFHFAGWFMVIVTLPEIFLTYLHSSKYILDAIAPLAFGVGITIGVYLSLYLFKKKYK